MDSIIFSECQEGVKDEELVAFQEKTNLRFPPAFEKFLKETNGGYPQGTLFTNEFVEIDPETGEEHVQGTDVDQFYSLEEIEFDYFDYSEDGYIPADYIPFAISSFGNLLLLYLGDTEGYGSVCFANHDLFDTKKGTFTISKVSTSFSAFISELHSPEEG